MNYIHIADYTEAAVVREMKVKNVHLEVAESIQQLEYKELGVYPSPTCTQMANGELKNECKTQRSRLCVCVVLVAFTNYEHSHWTSHFADSHGHGQEDWLSKSQPNHAIP